MNTLDIFEVPRFLYPVTCRPKSQNLFYAPPGMYKNPQINGIKYLVGGFNPFEKY